MKFTNVQNRYINNKSMGYSFIKGKRCSGKTYTSVLVPIRVHQGGNIDAESPSEPSMNIIAQIEALRAQVKSMNKELE